MGFASWFRFLTGRKPDDVSPRIAIASLSSDYEKQMVLVRAALRAFPGTSGLGAGQWLIGNETQLPIRLHSLRALFVAWCALAFEGVREGALREAFAGLSVPLATLDTGLADYFRLNIAHEYAIASSEGRTHAARRAIALVEAIQTLNIAQLPFDTQSRHADIFDTLKLSWENQQFWRDAQRCAIGADCALLREGQMTIAELAFAPLWPDSRTAALETNLALSCHLANANALGRDLLRWILERKDGALLFGLDPAKGRERALRTANLPDAFWSSRDTEDTLYSFNYCFEGSLDNATWGSTDQHNPLKSRAQT